MILNHQNFSMNLIKKALGREVENGINWVWSDFSGNPDNLRVSLDKTSSAVGPPPGALALHRWALPQHYLHSTLP